MSGGGGGGIKTIWVLNLKGVLNFTILRVVKLIKQKLAKKQI
jgi:hypothetical protein